MFSGMRGKKRTSEEKPFRREFPKGTELVRRPEEPLCDEKKDLTEEKIVMDENTGSSDYLLRQIDEFREKASELQALLQTRENKAQELQSLVEKKQREADDLSAGVTRSVERIMDRVNDRMDRKFDEMNGHIDRKLEEMSGGMNEKLEGIAKSADHTEELKTMIGEIKLPEVDTEKLTEEIKAPLDDFQKSIDGVKAPLDKAAKEIDGMRTEVLEKIHTEGVQVFKNTRDLIDEQGQKLEVVSDLKTEVKSLKTTLKIALWFGIINFAVLIVYVLYDLGVFNFK